MENNEKMTTDMMEERTDIGIKVELPTTAKDVLPIDCKSALATFSVEEQEEITALSQAIDVKRVENIMAYGSEPMRNTYEQCGHFLKEKRGSVADQQVIAQVIELSKKASESYDDFNLKLQEPNFFQKFWLKLFNGNKKRNERIQQSAVTSYKLLGELKSSCEIWLDMLKRSMLDITDSAMSDVEQAILLEKYIIAGKIAQERIENEIENAKSQYEKTGLQKYAQEYDELKQGYEIFLITMSNLEKSRVAYKLSVAELALVKKGNTNVQISIHTQASNTMALIGQQLRNAILNAETKEVVEGQKALTRLNDELLKEVSKSIGLTTEETQKLIYAGFYNLSAAKEAITSVITSSKAIEKTAQEMLPKMQNEMTEVQNLLNELEPCIKSTPQLTSSSSGETLKIENKPSTGGLKF